MWLVGEAWEWDEEDGLGLLVIWLHILWNIKLDMEVKKKNYSLFVDKKFGATVTFRYYTYLCQQ